MCALSRKGKTQQNFEQNLKDSALATIRGDNSLGQVLLIFDIKKYGTLRDTLYNRLVRAVLNARSLSGEAPGTLGPGDIALVLDGGKPGNKDKLLAPWKKEGASNDSKKKTDEEEADDGEEGDEEDEDAEDKPNLVCDKLFLA